MIYRTTVQTDQDITELYLQGYTLFGAAQADRYVAGLIDAFDLLARNPHMARERTEFRPPVRLHPYRSHLIVYVERHDGVLILRVLYGRQNWEQHLA